jgi:hypothetical protein
MKAGPLDRRVSILREGPAVDDGYTMVPGGLGLLATRWASWKPATRAEQFENAGNEAKLGGTFWLRSDSTTRHIVETDKVVHDGRTYDILGLSEIGRREGIELLVAGNDEELEIDLSGLSPIPDATTTYTGWGYYVHTGATQDIAAGVEEALVNNAGTIDESQKPADIATFYDGTKVVGRFGDSIILGVQLIFTPADGAASTLTISVDNGSVLRLYTEEFALSGGSGVEHKISYHPPSFMLTNFTANGGTIKVTCDGDGTISTVRYSIHRLHKAR